MECSRRLLGVLLIAAACAAILLRWAGASERRTRLSATGLAIAFVFLAADELFSLHERLQAATGINWQLLLVPVAVAAGAAWTVVVIAVGHATRAVLLLVGGAALWVTAQAIEALAWSADLGYHSEGRAEIIAEETLEMYGSLLLAVGLLVASRHLAARSETR